MLGENFHPFFGRRRGHAAPLGGDHTCCDQRASEVYVDSLNLKGAVIAPGFILNESPGGGFILHTVCGCRARRVGWFRGAAEAWRAIDSFDQLTSTTSR